MVASHTSLAKHPLREDTAARVANFAATRLRAQGLVVLVVPVTCSLEAPGGCGVHVAELGTSGVDLDAVTVLQLLQEPALLTPEQFGFAVALHLEGKVSVRVVFAYICPPEALLVPLTRWVLRSPRGAATILAAPRAPPNDRPAPVLIYPGDIKELCEESPATPEATDTIEIEDAKVGHQLQLVLERLWYKELHSRQLSPQSPEGTPGALTSSVVLRHRVAANGRVECSGFSLARLDCREGRPAQARQGGHLVPYASDWGQLEEQLRGLLAERVMPKQQAPAHESRRARQGGRKRAQPKQQLSLARHHSQEEQQVEVPAPDGDLLDESEAELASGEVVDNHPALDIQQLQQREVDVVQSRASVDSHLDGSEADLASDVPAECSVGTPPEQEVAASSTTPPHLQDERGAKADLEVASAQHTSSGGSSGKAESVQGSAGKREVDGPRKAASASPVGMPSRTKSRSWADLSEEDDEDDVDRFVFQSPCLRNQLASNLQGATSVGHQSSWTDIGAALEALPGKVSEAISEAILQATGVEAHIPSRRIDVPASQRFTSSTAANASSLCGMLSGPAWIPAESELGQWYELRLEHERLLCGVVLRGCEEHGAWVQIVKLKIRSLDGAWADINGGSLFQACHDAEQEVDVMMDPVKAVAVRIYPVVWHGSIALHVGLLEPPAKLSLEAGTTASFRDHAGMETAAMVSSELGALHDLGRSLSSQHVGGGPAPSIPDLVSKLFAVPNQVATAAQRVEAKVVEAWKKIATADSADAALQSARQWVDTIPEELPLLVSARAQAAAMDQVCAALALLEELQQLTASSIADGVLRAKVTESRSPSESERLLTGLGKRGSTSRAGSSVTLEPVLEAHGDEGEDRQEEEWTDAVEYHGCSSARGKRSCQSESPLLTSRSPSPSREFWVDAFLASHAFRIGGSEAAWIWQPEAAAFEYTVYSKAGQAVLQRGSATAGILVQLTDLDRKRAVFVSVILGDSKVAAPLMPLSHLDHWGVMNASARSVTAVFALSRDHSRCCRGLAVQDGRPQIIKGGAGWEHETAHRQWKVAKRGAGFSVRHRQGKELNYDGSEVVLTDEGATWEFEPVEGRDGLSIHLASGGGAVSFAPGGELIFSTDRALWADWHVFEQTHCELPPADLVSMPPIQPDSDAGGVFRAAEAWRQARSSAQHGGPKPASAADRPAPQPTKT